MKRLMSIAYELGPVAGEYLMEFQIRPWVHGLLNVEDDDATMEVEKKRKKHELESSLSQKLRSSLTHLGPTFIKVGYGLSCQSFKLCPKTFEWLFVHLILCQVKHY